MNGAKISVINEKLVSHLAGYLMGLSELFDRIYCAFIIEGIILKREDELLKYFYGADSVIVTKVQVIGDWDDFIGSCLKNNYFSFLEKIKTDSFIDKLAFQVIDQISFIIENHKIEKVSLVQVTHSNKKSCHYYLFFMETDIFVLQFCF